MAFLGLRKWPTPVRRPENASSVCTDRSALFPSVLRGDYFQVMKPLWPFIAASGITFYLVSKVQDAAVRCTFFAYKLASHSPQSCARGDMILMPRLQRPSTRRTPRTRTLSRLRRRLTTRRVLSVLVALQYHIHGSPPNANSYNHCASPAGPSSSTHVPAHTMGPLCTTYSC